MFKILKKEFPNLYKHFNNLPETAKVSGHFIDGLISQLCNPNADKKKLDLLYAEKFMRAMNNVSVIVRSDDSNITATYDPYNLPKLEVRYSHLFIDLFEKYKMDLMIANPDHEILIGQLDLNTVVNYLDLQSMTLYGK